MPDPIEHCLLFGLLALREEIIDPATLVELLGAWSQDETRRLHEIVQERGILTVEQLLLLKAKVAQRLGRPEGVTGDPLTDVGPGEAIRSSLATRLDVGLGMSRDGDVAFEESPSVATGSEPTLTLGSDTAPGATAARPRPGIRYHILDLLASGGLGEVYIARDEELNRHVALKLIRRRCAHDAPSRARFLLEAGITSALEHPGIVPVHGHGVFSDGRPYYTMRLIKGEPFKDAILRFHRRDAAGQDPRARALELRQLLRRFLDVCNVIDYAHSRKILHRDLKPSNIMLGPYGETLVVDWGLAKDLGQGARDAPAGASSWGEPVPDGAACSATPSTEFEPTMMENSGTREPDHATLPGTPLGTPRYMSPEQAAGRIDQIGFATDVYGLGATLYFLLTGTPPGAGPGVSTILSKVQTGEIAPPRQVRAWVPGALAAICMKALAPKPEERYASPGALAVDIEHWLADEPVSTHRDPISVRLTRWGRRHRSFAVAGGVLLISAVVGLTLGTVLLSRANRLTERQRNLAEESARRLELQLYVHRVNLAHRECLQNNISQAETLLALCPIPSRGWEWSYVARLCHQERFSFLGHDECVNAVAFSPDGTKIVSGSGKPFSRPRAGDHAELVLWDAKSGRELRRFGDLKGSVHGVAFSPDGSLIASGSGFYGRALEGEGRLRVWDAETGAVVFDHREPYLNALCVAFSPDGRYLAAGFGLYSGDHFPGHFVVFEVSSGKVVFDEKPKVGGINALSFHPDSRRLAVAGTGVVELWDVIEKEKLHDLRGHESWVYAVAFHPDGRHLVSGGWDHTIRQWDLSSWSEVRRIEAHAGHVLSVAFSPDGTKIASCGDDSVLKVWDAATGHELMTLRGHATLTTGTLGIAFSPDGTRLASAGGDRTVKLWDIDTARQATFHDQKGWISSLLCLPDEATVVSASGDHTIAQWDAETGRLLRRFPGHGDWVLCLALSPDGRRLASGSADMIVRIWDLASGQTLRVFGGYDAFVRGVAFSPDGRFLVSGTGSGDRDPLRGDVSLWDLASGEHVRTLVKDIGPVNYVAFSPDGRSLAIVILGREGPEPVPSKVLVFDWPACRLRLTLVNSPGDARNPEAGVTGSTLAFSPDGRRLALDCPGGVVKIYDTRDGRLERTLPGHTLQVNSLAFSPDGRRLASASYDKLIKLWDTATGEEILSLRGHEGGVISIAFSPDGRRLVSGGVDWTARVWDARPLSYANAPGIAAP